MTPRQQYISDLVDNYIKNDKEEYKEFLKLMKHKKMLLQDQESGIAKDQKIRSAFKFPQKLYTFLESVDNPPFLSLKGESKWFSKKYHSFLLPNSF